MSKVSVIMSVHREREEYLQQAMASLLRQTFRDLEILVYLDGRQPRLWKLLKDLAAEDPRIQVLGEEATVSMPVLTGLPESSSPGWTAMTSQSPKELSARCVSWNIILHVILWDAIRCCLMRAASMEAGR